MFDELNKYRDHDHFIFAPADELTTVCNAPCDKSGIYIVYILAQNKIELAYIGRSGKKKADGSIFIRKTGLGGLKDRIVNGLQFGKVPRRIAWSKQMKLEKIEALDIYWYVTYNAENFDCPAEVEKLLLRKHFNFFGKLPRWNYEINI